MAGAGDNNEEMVAMKLLDLSKTSRRRWLAAGCFALVAMSFATAYAIERPLTDADVARYLPRLRAEAAAFTKNVREGREVTAAIVSRSEENEKLYTDIASGKVDVLEWLRAQSEYVLIPEGTLYSAECSRAVTGEGAVPTAVFTFGKESPYRDLLRRAASGDEGALAEFNTRRGEEEARKRTTEEQATHDFVAGTIAFYRGRGFVDAEGSMLSIFITALVAPDRRVNVTVSEANYYCGLLPRDTPPACSSLPTGPLLEISLAGESGADAAGAAANDTLAADTAKEKPDPEYVRVKEALLLARIDADNLSQLEIEIPPDAPAEAKAAIASVAAEFAVRKANVLMYKRHEVELAPILDALLELSEK
jgi:hypothetical protein